MGKVEKEAGKKIKARRIQDGVLLGLYASVGLALIITAPGAAQLLRYIDPDIKKKGDPSQRMSQAVSRLVKGGFIKRTKTADGKTRLTLTTKGKQKAEHIHLLSIKPAKSNRWDKRWRIVIFDVWEKRKYTRDCLRTMLQRVGFVKVQNSVWAYPYDCEEILALIKAELKLGKGVLYFVAEGVENDKDLRRHFDLPSK